MNSAQIIKEDDGTYTVDAGIQGMDGYKDKRTAQYAMMLYLGGGTLVTPEQAAREIPDGWEY